MMKNETRYMNRVLTKYIILVVALLMGGAAVAQSSSGVHVGGRVFGGGNEANVKGSSSVTVKQTGTTSSPLPPTINDDVYGGGALAHVNVTTTVDPETENTTYSHTSGATTTVDITYGTINGNVYGGGLGDDDHAAAVFGEVTVNIGERIGPLDEHGFAPSESVFGNATLNGSVFGCNNANGTPKDNVTVNIYETAHTSGDDGNTVAGTGFAIAEVFGGGNKAHYEPAGANKKATVHVWTCDNTIQYVYGGGNAANVGTAGINSATDVIIDGGRIEWVFGGGNGHSATGNHDDPTAPNYNPGANIYGDASSTFHGGKVSYFFGGSNEYGTISGDKTISIPNDGRCTDNYIAELYGGNNLAPTVGNITLTMPCQSTPCKIDYLFGGSRNADVGTAEAPANIVLTVAGGLYDYVFGGNNQGGTIYGDVTLNLFGGTINEAAFGGNNAGGDINGKITVNMLQQGQCPLVVHNIYGGGNEAAYTPTFTLPEGTTAYYYPEVNLIHGTVSKKTDGTGGNVFGGGLGSTATVTANPVVNVGYNTSMAALVSSLLPSGTSLTDNIVSIEGDVYGGGELAGVVGGTTIIINKVPASESSTATTTTTISGDVYGGGALADTGGSEVTLNGGTVHDIYGGGLGRLADSDHDITAVAAEVDGDVQVTVNGGTVNGAVYGCNNANGAPTGSVKVDIYGTDEPAQGQTYALGSVFGGGNMAAYGGTPDVTIHNCDNKIGEVYGGGNKASVVNTNVIVYGGNTIGKVFAGGNGEGVAASHVMVSGNAIAHIHGGTIGQVFGGNNASGTISGNASALYINKQPEQENGTACTMKIGEVYGGGNLAAGNASAITVGCTGTLVSLGANQHYGTDQEGIGTVYGGANAANVGNNITLNINSGIVENVFGGNNASGSISGQIQVNINQTNETTDCSWYVGNVYGGGNHAAYSGTPDVNIIAGTVSGNVFGGGNDITTANAGVAGSDVEMTGGTVLGGIYGGCNLNGTVTTNSQVVIKGGTIGSQDQLTAGTTADVFGGGLGENTNVTGGVTVTISRASGESAPAAPTIYGDVYGGSALGSVNTTTVNIMDGTLHSVTDNSTGFTVYHGGNVYGGGLGRKAVGQEGSEGYVPAIAAAVNGAVIVNIGTGTLSPTETGINFTGNATIEGNVYGCNNTNGSPQDNVTVNVYRTAHTEGVNEVGDPGYAIANVFGGGNEADYAPENGATNTTKKATVNIFGCLNTIERTFGGGNAAATPTVETNIQGGHINQAFGGGNGERGVSYGANVNGDVYLNIYGGHIGQSFGGSNQNGTISGQIHIVADDNGPCGSMVVDEFFCGGNFVDITGNVETTITCSQGMEVRDLYGGCNMANISGYVVLNVYGGIYTNVYGGSKGDLLGLGTGHINKEANIGGNVTLNLYGGTIETVYGGSNINGDIEGVITVNVLDVEGDCPLNIINIYGGSNLTSYAPSSPTITSPIVNVVHIKNGITGNVYGGSKGKEGATGEDVTQVKANPLVNIGYDAATMNNSNNVYIQSYVSAHSSLIAAPRAIVSGSVFGGGDAAEVLGNTKVFLRNRAKVFGNVYGGGNMGEVKDNPDTDEVEGNTKVIVNGITTQP